MKKFKFLYIAAAALLFAACANEEDGTGGHFQQYQNPWNCRQRQLDSRRCYRRICLIIRLYNRRQQKVCNNKWGWYF